MPPYFVILKSTIPLPRDMFILHIPKYKRKELNTQEAPSAASTNLMFGNWIISKLWLKESAEKGMNNSATPKFKEYLGNYLFCLSFLICKMGRIHTLSIVQTYVSVKWGVIEKFAWISGFYCSINVANTYLVPHILHSAVFKKCKVK